MNDGLTTSASGQGLVKSFESCLKAVPGRKGYFATYICPAGVLTIGWGHTNANGRKFKAGDVWTQGECDAALREDLQVAERAVRRRVKVELTQGQFDSLVSFSMNCGEGALTKSTMLRKVNIKDFEGAADAFAMWNKGKDPHTGQLVVLNGLTRRRKAEADLFRSGNHDLVHAEYKATPEYNEPCPQAVDAPDGTVKPMATSKIGNAQVAISMASAAEAASKVKEAVDQANSVKAGVKDLGVLDVLGNVAAMPTFWIAVSVVVVAGFAWYWRREHAQNGT